MGKKVVVEFIGKDDDLRRAFNQSQGMAHSFGGAMKTAAIGLGSLAAAGTVAAAKIGIDGVKAYGDFLETVNKSDAVFGTSAETIRNWADTAVTSLGLSRTEALDAAGTFGNMFDQLGIGSEKAASMSMGITQLAADFGSFHNADITQVIEAQSAAFRGEYDALQRFLPLINAAAVEQKAMEMTGKDNAAAVTAQEKALAVYQLMLEGAGKAQGDFAKTSDSMANSQRILGAAFKDIKIDIGNILMNDALPAFLDGLGLGGEKGLTMAESIEKVQKWVKESGPAVASFAKDVGTLVRAFLDVVGAISDAVRWLDKFIGKGSTANKIAVDLANLVLPGNPIPQPKKRAHGGPLVGGETYLVGENGPELARFPRSGYMSTGGGGGGGVVVNIYAEGSILSEYDLEAFVVEALENRKRRGA